MATTDDYAKIQVPLKASIKKKAEQVAEDYGYSSIQEVIRIFLTNFSKGDIQLQLRNTHAVEYISPEFEAFLEKREKEFKKAIKARKAYTIHSAKELTTLVENYKQED